MKQKVKVNISQNDNKGPVTPEEQIANPITKDMATEQITQIINQSGMPPKLLAVIGILAQQAINNPKDYKKFVHFMVKNKLESEETLKKPDYQMLASMAVIGKVAETLPNGQLPQNLQSKQQGPVEPTQG